MMIVRSMVTLAVLLMTAPQALAADPVHFDNPEQAYAAGNFDEALRLFLDAEVMHPKDPRVAYDLGNTHYRKGEFDAAAQAYNRALASGDSALKAKANYNLGNALFRAQKLEDAVKAYEQALTLAPKDDDARHNLEVARKALALQKKQPDSNNRPDESKSESKSSPKTDPGATPQPKDGDKLKSPEPKPGSPADEKQPQPAGADQAKKDQQGAGKPGNDKPPDNKPGDSKPGGDKPGEKQPATGGDGTEQPTGMTRGEAERYLQQIGDTRPRAPRNQRGGRTATPAKDW